MCSSRYLVNTTGCFWKSEHGYWHFLQVTTLWWKFVKAEKMFSITSSTHLPLRTTVTFGCSSSIPRNRLKSRSVFATLTSRRGCGPSSVGDVDLTPRTVTYGWQNCETNTTTDSQPVSTVASYDLGDWGPISGRGTVHSLYLHFQADAAAYIATSLIRIGGPLPGGKEAEAWGWEPSTSISRIKMLGAIPSL
jgi:hypothetical protein